MAELEVHLYGTLLGHLVGERARFDFVAAPAALERFGIGATVLSLAIPLSANPRAALVGERRNFFEELLPEGRHRKRLADNAHIDEYAFGNMQNHVPKAPRRLLLHKAEIRKLFGLAAVKERRIGFGPA